MLLKKLRYSLHIIFHPFDGFWELKFSKKGDLLSASILLALFIFAYIFRSQATGFLFNEFDVKSQNVMYEIRLILILLALWCVSNWSLTTLLDGEGSFKEIFISSVYALTPMTLIYIPLTIASNIMLNEEKEFFVFFSIVSVLWFVFLLWSGMMVIHGYTPSKATVTFLMSFAGMAVITFLLLLFVDIYDGMIDFARTIIREIFIRG